MFLPQDFPPAWMEELLNYHNTNISHLSIGRGRGKKSAYIGKKELDDFNMDKGMGPN